MGPPNDEGLGSHPLAALGLKWYSVHEVMNSSLVTRIATTSLSPATNSRKARPLVLGLYRLLVRCQNPSLFPVASPVINRSRALSALLGRLSIPCIYYHRNREAGLRYYVAGQRPRPPKNQWLVQCQRTQLARLLRNTYTARANGSSPSACSTNAAKPVMFLRKSIRVAMHVDLQFTVEPEHGSAPASRSSSTSCSLQPSLSVTPLGSSATSWDGGDMHSRECAILMRVGRPRTSVTEA